MQEHVLSVLCRNMSECVVLCRNMSERHRKEADSYGRQLKDLQAQVEPLKRQAIELQAHVDSHREEIRIVSTSLRQYRACCIAMGLCRVPSDTHVCKVSVGPAFGHIIVAQLCWPYQLWCATDR